MIWRHHFRRLTTFAVATILFSPVRAGAAVTELVPWTLDSPGGLSANVPFSMEWVQVSGTRRSPIPWGQGPVNYVAGATVYAYAPSPGTLDVDLLANGPGGTYGSGTGFKAFVQFWNDPQNYVAIGLIHDSWACPLCGPGQVTLMIEGNSTFGQSGPG